MGIAVIKTFWTRIARTDTDFLNAFSVQSRESVLSVCKDHDNSDICFMKLQEKILDFIYWQEYKRDDCYEHTSRAI